MFSFAAGRYGETRHEKTSHHRVPAAGCRGHRGRRLRGVRASACHPAATGPRRLSPRGGFRKTALIAAAGLLAALGAPAVASASVTPAPVPLLIGTGSTYEVNSVNYDLPWLYSSSSNLMIEDNGTAWTVIEVSANLGGNWQEYVDGSTGKCLYLDWPANVLDLLACNSGKTSDLWRSSKYGTQPSWVMGNDYLLTTGDYPCPGTTDTSVISASVGSQLYMECPDSGTSTYGTDQRWIWNAS